MAFLTGDVMEITAHMTFNGVKGVNRYHYILGGQTASAILAGDAFENLVLPTLLTIASNGLVYTKLVCQNLFDKLEVDERALTGVGNTPVGGEPLSPHISWPFNLTHTDATVRAGGKRFMGVTEGQSLNGLFPVVAMTGTMSAIESILASNLDIGGGLSALLPVVVGLLSDGIGGYNLPTTQTELLTRGFGFVTDAAIGYLSSQNSRKRYAGE